MNSKLIVGAIVMALAIGFIYSKMKSTKKSTSADISTEVKNEPNVQVIKNDLSESTKIGEKLPDLPKAEFNAVKEKEEYLNNLPSEEREVVQKNEQEAKLIDEAYAKKVNDDFLRKKQVVEKAMQVSSNNVRNSLNVQPRSPVDTSKTTSFSKPELKPITEHPNEFVPSAGVTVAPAATNDFNLKAKREELNK